MSPGRGLATGAKEVGETERVPPFQFAQVHVHAAQSRRLEVDPLAPGSVVPHTEELVPLDTGGGSGEQTKDKPPQRPGPKCAEA
ncbi:MAG TPA: hypothetical protein VFZ93_05390, partial [Albitalea sp.]